MVYCDMGMKIFTKSTGKRRLNRNCFLPFKKFNVLWLKVGQREITNEKANVKTALEGMPVLSH
jgi:hypothetical protein